MPDTLVIIFCRHFNQYRHSRLARYVSDSREVQYQARWSDKTRKVVDPHLFAL
ncbi:hypothetical protein KCP71_14890 [Salmonella enterica subsp. enterica]|nr:hypothetical protein KCP71_14890 [Salmonella enterica subsp. enterica]